MKFRWLTGAAVALCLATGSASTAVRRATRLHGPRSPGQQDLDPAVDVRRVHRLRHGRGHDRAHRDRPRRAARDGLPQRRAVHAQRPVRERLPGLLDEYGLKASARHVDVGTPESPTDFDQILADNKTLGIHYFGSGSTPIFPPIYTTEAQWVAYAEYLNALGARARQAGQTLFVHNHDVEFEAVFGGRTVFDILMAHTDPKNVAFQLDLYWAANGGGIGNPLAVIERYGNRIQLFHVKDMAAGPFPGRIEIVGEGIIDFPTIFAAAGGSTKYYVVEHDPRFGDPTFDPFEAAEKGFDYLDCVTF